MSSEFKVGDVVRLKSGGPPMTVCAVHDDKPVVDVEWFVGGTLDQCIFMVDTLVHTDPNVVSFSKVFIFNYPAGNAEAKLNQEANASRIRGGWAIAIGRDPMGTWSAVECVETGEFFAVKKEESK